MWPGYGNCYNGRWEAPGNFRGAPVVFDAVKNNLFYGANDTGDAKIRSAESSGT
jgi:hypothetical protein